MGIKVIYLNNKESFQVEGYTQDETFVYFNYEDDSYAVNAKVPISSILKILEYELK